MVSIAHLDVTHPVRLQAELEILDHLVTLLQLASKFQKLLFAPLLVVLDLVDFLAEAAAAQAATGATVKHSCQGRVLEAVSLDIGIVDAFDVQLGGHGHALATLAGELAAGSTNAVEMWCEPRSGLCRGSSEQVVIVFVLIMGAYDRL